jgi:2-furoyl-CoA dehydrogenase 2Fe-2S iron sulfur subunit
MSEEIPRDDEPRLVRLTVNGTPRTGVATDRTLLSDFLRHELGLTGTHIGCEHGVCGACTVAIDGAPARSCLAFAVQAEGRRIDTVEGLSDGERLSDLQRAFQDNHALQCGYCTSGFLITAGTLLDENPDPSDEEIREYLSGNICRCTGYVGIVGAVKQVAAERAASANGERAR